MPTLRDLTPLTVARVRSGVVAALVSTATRLDDNLARSLPQGRYSLILSGPGGIKRRLVFQDGRALETSGFGASATLRFPSAEAMAQALGGGKGMVIPLPGGPAFLKSIKSFMTASKRVGQLTGPTGLESADLPVVTEMLMTAALRGVAETAQTDPWTAPKSSKMPDGVVQLTVGDHPLQGWLQRRGSSWTGGTGEAPGKVNARLSFDSLETAYGLFTGKVAALGALGRGTVAIRGKVPMIQILFPLLDRFGEIMAWGKESASEGAAL